MVLGGADFELGPGVPAGGFDVWGEEELIPRPGPLLCTG